MPEQACKQFSYILAPNYKADCPHSRTIIKHNLERVKPIPLLLPLHEVEIPNEDRHLIVGVHIALSSRLVGVLVILDPDPLMVMMMMMMMAGVGSSGHCDAHPCKSFNHSLVRRRSIAL